MPQITLKKEQVQQLVDFCDKQGCKNWFLAKDQGAYVGASAGEKGNCIFYFKGCDPSKDAEWYDNARNAFGGDDFGQHFDTRMLRDALKIQDMTGFVVKVNPRSISMQVVRGRK